MLERLGRGRWNFVITVATPEVSRYGWGTYCKKKENHPIRSARQLLRSKASSVEGQWPKTLQVGGRDGRSLGL